MKGCLIWLILKGFLQSVESFELPKIILRIEFPFFNKFSLTGDFAIMDFQYLQENPSYIKLQTMLIIILPLLFNTKSRVFHLLFSFIIVLLTLLQWCLSNIISNAAKTNPFVCCLLLQLFSISKCSICFIYFWGSVSCCWYVGGRLWWVSYLRNYQRRALWISNIETIKVTVGSDE